MIAEESGKWVAEFSKCKTKRDVDTVLRKLAASERMPIDPEHESYARIAEKLGLTEGANVRESLDCALARVHRVYG